MQYYFEHRGESCLGWKKGSPWGPREGTESQGLSHLWVSGFLNSMLWQPRHKNLGQQLKHHMELLRRLSRTVPPQPREVCQAPFSDIMAPRGIIWLPCRSYTHKALIHLTLSHPCNCRGDNQVVTQDVWFGQDCPVEFENLSILETAAATEH